MSGGLGVGEEIGLALIPMIKFVDQLIRPSKAITNVSPSSPTRLPLSVATVVIAVAGVGTVFGAIVAELVPGPSGGVNTLYRGVRWCKAWLPTAVGAVVGVTGSG